MSSRPTGESVSEKQRANWELNLELWPSVFFQTQLFRAAHLCWAVGLPNEPLTPFHQPGVCRDPGGCPRDWRDSWAAKGTWC